MCLCSRASSREVPATCLNAQCIYGSCADLEAKRPLPGRMLDLMTLLERESGPFCRKRLITISGHDRGLVYSANADMTLLDAIRSALSAFSHQAPSFDTACPPAPRADGLSRSKSSTKGMYDLQSKAQYLSDSGPPGAGASSCSRASPRPAAWYRCTGWPSSTPTAMWSASSASWTSCGAHGSLLHSSHAAIRTTRHVAIAAWQPVHERSSAEPSRCA